MATPSFDRLSRAVNCEVTHVFRRRTRAYGYRWSWWVTLGAGRPPGIPPTRHLAPTRELKDPRVLLPLLWEMGRDPGESLGQRGARRFLDALGDAYSARAGART